MAAANITGKSCAGIFWLMAALAVGPAAAEEEQAVLLTMTTSYGDVQLELYTDKAPLTANNFLEYVDAGYYDGSIPPGRKMANLMQRLQPDTPFLIVTKKNFREFDVLL